MTELKPVPTIVTDAPTGPLVGTKYETANGVYRVMERRFPTGS